MLEHFGRLCSCWDLASQPINILNQVSVKVGIVELRSFPLKFLSLLLVCFTLELLDLLTNIGGDGQVVRE
jgi:hypothetical protein